MSFIQVYGIALAIILGMMFVLWILSLGLKNSSIVDIFWGTGFVISGWVYYAFTPDGFITRKLLLCVLTTIWGLRLSVYILWRNWGKGEDFRYQVWRKEAGNQWWWRSFFKVFFLQGILMWIISAPLLAAQVKGTPDKLTTVDFLAILDGKACRLSFYFLGFLMGNVKPGNSGAPIERIRSSSVVLLTFGFSRHSPPPNSSVASRTASSGLFAQISFVNSSRSV